MSLLGSINNFFQTKPVTAALSEYDPSTGGEKVEKTSPNTLSAGSLGSTKAPTWQAFQYFPERVTDTKSANYAQKEVPGGSHPIYTFINSGARVISFDAIFTNDTNPVEKSTLENVLSGNFISRDVKRKDTVDVAAAIAWLRQYLYPEYSDNIALNPKLLTVYLPESGIVGHGGIPGSIIGIMTRCDVAYEAFHRDGTPRIAVVSLEFHEIVQTSANWTFVGASEVKAIDSNRVTLEYKAEMIEPEVKSNTI